MERIGIAASKIARGNIFLYNFFVVLLSVLFSFFLFFIAGTSIVLGLIIVGYLVNAISPVDINDEWMAIIRVCMVTLTLLVSVVSCVAILKNIKTKV